MLHPPQEGSDRILTYGTLLDVLWQMYHSLDHLWDGQKDCLDVGEVRMLP